jgi:hypothetical protein
VSGARPPDRPRERNLGGRQTFDARRDPRSPGFASASEADPKDRGSDSRAAMGFATWSLTMRLDRFAIFGLFLGLAACGGGGGGGGGGTTPVFPVAFDASNFSGAAIDNPFFPLPVGRTWTYEKSTPDGLEQEVVTVTNQTKTILGIPCVVVHATGTLDGELTEDTFDWYAQDDDGNVWYLGEATTEFENGVPVSTAGSWEAGVDGALAGVIMFASPVLGTTYSQEFYEDEAEDFAKVVGLGESVTIPLATYAGCLHTEDWTPLEPGIVEDKFYAPSVGTVLEIDADGFRLELVSVTP